MTNKEKFFEVFGFNPQVIRITPQIEFSDWLNSPYGDDIDGQVQKISDSLCVLMGCPPELQQPTVTKEEIAQYINSSLFNWSKLP